MAAKKTNARKFVVLNEFGYADSPLTLAEAKKQALEECNDYGENFVILQVVGRARYIDPKPASYVKYEEVK